MRKDVSWGIRREGGIAERATTGKSGVELAYCDNNNNNKRSRKNESKQRTMSQVGQYGIVIGLIRNPVYP